MTCDYCPGYRTSPWSRTDRQHHRGAKPLHTPCVRSHIATGIKHCGKVVSSGNRRPRSVDLSPWCSHQRAMVSAHRIAGRTLSWTICIGTPAFSSIQSTLLNETWRYHLWATTSYVILSLLWLGILNSLKPKLSSGPRIVVPPPIESNKTPSQSAPGSGTALAQARVVDHPPTPTD